MRLAGLFSLLDCALVVFLDLSGFRALPQGRGYGGKDGEQSNNGVESHGSLSSNITKESLVPGRDHDPHRIANEHALRHKIQSRPEGLRSLFLKLGRYGTA